MEIQVYFTVDDDELISLRDFGYISDNEFEDKEAITKALHTIISDLWKMKMETPSHRLAQIFGYKSDKATEDIIATEDMRPGDSVLFVNDDWTDFIDVHMYKIINIIGRNAVLKKEKGFVNTDKKQSLLDKLAR